MESTCSLWIQQQVCNRQFLPRHTTVVHIHLCEINNIADFFPFFQSDLRKTLRDVEAEVICIDNNAISEFRTCVVMTLLTTRQAIDTISCNIQLE